MTSTEQEYHKTREEDEEQISKSKIEADRFVLMRILKQPPVNMKLVVRMPMACFSISNGSSRGLAAEVGWFKET